MKNIKLFIMLAVSLLCLSCMKDGDMLIGTLEDHDTPINSADDNIVLSKETASSLALTLFWDGTGNMSLNNPNAQIPSGTVINAVQFSADKAFGSVYEQKVEANAYALQLTGAELNRILTGLGYEGGVEAPLYIRMSTALGANMETKYGEAIEIQVTPFTVDMSTIQIAQVKDGELTGEVSYVPAAADGEYRGLFVASAGWYNCFFIEGDGTIWGAYEDGNPFPLEKKTNTWSWNVWFPESDGCYYADIDTEEAVWSAISIPSLSIDAGGEAVEMTFAKSQKAWRGVFKTTSDNASVRVSATGNLYDKSKGTGAVAGQKELSFATSADNTFTVSEEEVSSAITAGPAGTYTLFFYIETMTWELKEGDVPFEGEEPEQTHTVHLVGYDNFNLDDSHLMVYDEGTDTYSAEIKPLTWGQFGIQFIVDSKWSEAYAPDTQNAGKIVRSDKAAMPDVECVAGNTYKVTISLTDLTYSIEIVGEPVVPDDKEMLYAYWSWGSSWVTTDLASALLKDNDIYYGYVSSFGEDAGVNRRVVLYDTYLSAAGNAYDNGGLGCNNGANGTLGAIEAGDSNTYWPLWFETGLHRLEISGDKTTCTATPLTPVIANNSNSWAFTAMAFDSVAGTWSATMDFTEGDTFKVILSSDGSDWTYKYSGADGALHTVADDSDNIYVSEAGTYTVAIDLKDASGLTYSITKQ